MGKRERLTAKEISGFFDEIHQEFIDPFNWDPNPELPHAQRKTYTIKEFFYAKYHDRQCLYFKDEIEICKINFHEIFSGNLIYVSQVDDLKNKIKRITNSDNYSVTSKITGTNTNTSTMSSNLSNTNTTNVNTFDRFGNFSGESDATQLSRVLDQSRRIIETKQIIAKSEDKIMDYLIPSQKVRHNVSIEKKDDTTVSTFTANNQTNNSGSGTRNVTHTRGTEALQEIQALGIRLRKLRAEFIEQFSPLFHAV